VRKPAQAGSGLEPGATLARRRLEIRGRVQGVGFRPWVYRLATELGLAGHVGNDPRGAFVELEGPPAAIARFGERLLAEQPPLVEICEQDVSELPPEGERVFRILASRHEGEQRAEITPDTATCPDCLRELSDPADRRHAYPFINCTNCGPRYSIIRSVPYDRARTTMAAFTMCPDCQAEYDDPADRRFHAQPDACGICGPRVWLTDPAGDEIGGEAIAEAARRLHAGGIVAIKGLGGFHLACRADDDRAVAELRRRKAREAKPLAVMVGRLDNARQLAILDEPAEKILTSPAHPIVLAPKRAGAPVSEHVAPGTDTLGLMLPYTPLHALLFAAPVGDGGAGEPESGTNTLGPLVMTSGNPSAEPLCADNDEALRRLGRIADAFLLHDRDIERRVDDSVLMSVALPGRDGGRDQRVMPLRRSRGYAPAPVHVTRAAPATILALGGELKSTVCLLSGHDAVLSEHLGDLDNPAAFRNFTGAIARLEELLGQKPEHIACDLHPDYAATRHARELGLPVSEVQHHHAHIVSCMADNGLTGPVIGLACDGTGYGTDGAIWGCELLVCDEADFERAGQLRYFPLLGGDAAAVETWRPAVGFLAETFGADWPEACPDVARRIDSESLDLARRFLASPESPAIQTSSLGRLFDATAFLLGICERNRAEAQAPMALEAAAAACESAEPLLWSLLESEDGSLEIDYRPLIRDLTDGIATERPAAELARAFHEALAAALAFGVERVAERSGLERVLLSGGCFANRLLLARLWSLLRRSGLDVYIQHRVPAGDGGIALGQAVAAAARLERGSA